MKKREDPRHQKRIKVVKELFSQSFLKQTSREELVPKILKDLRKIDQLIEKGAPQWPIEKIGKVDLAILRLAVYELTIGQKEPPKVIIDEAVEIAKELGGETSSKFVNGVLGTILTWKNSKAGFRNT